MSVKDHLHEKDSHYVLAFVARENLIDKVDESKVWRHRSLSYYNVTPLYQKLTHQLVRVDIKPVCRRLSNPGLLGLAMPNQLST